jgi:hypothetical protein
MAGDWAGRIGSHVFLFSFSASGGRMDLPTWYFSLSFGILAVAAYLCYGVD